MSKACNKTKFAFIKYGCFNFIEYQFVGWSLFLDTDLWCVITFYWYSICMVSNWSGVIICVRIVQILKHRYLCQRHRYRSKHPSCQWHFIFIPLIYPKLNASFNYNCLRHDFIVVLQEPFGNMLSTNTLCKWPMVPRIRAIFWSIWSITLMYVGFQSALTCFVRHLDNRVL